MPAPVGFTLDIDLRSFTEGLDDTQQKQIPFATAKALNATALEFQTAERAHLHDIFTIRRPAWVDRSVKITHFAKKAELWATIAIDPPGDRDDIIGKFETDTEKTAHDGGHVAIPVDARRDKNDIVVGRNRPKALNLHEEHGKLVGDKGTFVVALPNGSSIIVQRQGAKRGKKVQGYDTGFGGGGSFGQGDTSRVGAADARTVVLFLLVPKVGIRPDLRFVATATAVVDRSWVKHMDAALAAALETAR